MAESAEIAARESKIQVGTAPAVHQQKTVLIVNTKARRGQEWYAQTQDCLKQQGVPLAAAYELDHPDRMSDLVRFSIADGAERILIGGGDGSFRSVVKHFLNTEVALGVLPLGTVNDFARNLGIEAEVGAACRVIAAGRTRKVHVGMANDEPFLITASLGFSAQSQKSLKPGLKKMLGPFGYLVASLLALHHLRHLQVTIKSEQGEECCDALQVGVVSGHSWMGGKFEIPGVGLSSDSLAFYALPARNHQNYFRMLRSLMHGQFFHTPGLRAFTTREMWLTTEKPRSLVLDGDLCGKTPVHIRLLPEALTVCAPDSVLPTNL